MGIMRKFDFQKFRIPISSPHTKATTFGTGQRVLNKKDKEPLPSLFCGLAEMINKTSTPNEIQLQGICLRIDLTTCSCIIVQPPS